MAPISDDLLLVGRIGAAFGVRGQIKLHAMTDYPDHLIHNITTLYIGDQQAPYRLLDAFEHKPGILVLTLGGITTREAAQGLRHAEVFIAADASIPLGEDEYYLHDLYGLRVETHEGVELGSVREVLETGANEVLVVARPDQPDVLIPMIHDVVEDLDIAAGRVVIRLLAGLLP